MIDWTKWQLILDSVSYEELVESMSDLKSILEKFPEDCESVKWNVFIKESQILIEALLSNNNRWFYLTSIDNNEDGGD